MSTTKRRRLHRITADQCRKIIAWKRLSQLCKELGVSPKTAAWHRAKHRQVFK